jgi:hypothetical protein
MESPLITQVPARPEKIKIHFDGAGRHTYAAVFVNTR